MEPELEPGFDLNYPVPLLKELPGFSGSGSEPGSITSMYSLYLGNIFIPLSSLKAYKKLDNLH